MAIFLTVVIGRTIPSFTFCRNPGLHFAFTVPDQQVYDSGDFRNRANKKRIRFSSQQDKVKQADDEHS
jgi:hypothetical protein